MVKQFFKMLVRGFVVSLLIVLILFGTGILFYKGIMRYFKAPEMQVFQSNEQIEVEKKVFEARVDDISKNLIYCINEETGLIEKLLLEIFHCEKKQIYYITIPIRTQFTMSNTLYRQLILVHPAIPQLLKLSGFSKYFNRDTVYDYGALLIEDMLDIKLSYYTVIPKSLYETMFTAKVKETEETDEDPLRPYIIEVFSQEYQIYLDSMQSAEDISNYIEELYTVTESNLSLKDKMNYLDSYCLTPRSNISFELLKGKESNSAYLVDQQAAKQQIQSYME